MKILKTTLLLSALAASFGASAAERIYLQVPIKISPDTGIPPNVKAECAIEQHLADYASKYITKEYRRVELASATDDVGNDQVIKLTITKGFGVGGGAWAGPKSVTILAELKQGGATVASLTRTRSTMSLGGFFSGTCPMYHKVTRELGEDVAEWLKDGAPTRAAPAEEAQKPAE